MNPHATTPVVPSAQADGQPTAPQARFQPPATKPPGKKRKALLLGIGVVLVMVLYPFLSYVLIPVLSPFESVPVPPYCTAAVSRLPSTQDYAIPGGGMGTLLTGDAQSAVVVTATYGQVPFSSTVYLIRKSDNHIVQSLRFDNDIVSANIKDGILYLFNDKILYMLDTSTGALVRNLVKTDNFRGLYTSGDTQYLQTNFEMSGIKGDLSGFFHVELHFASIAFGCYWP